MFLRIGLDGVDPVSSLKRVVPAFVEPWVGGVQEDITTDVEPGGEHSEYDDVLR